MPDINVNKLSEALNTKADIDLNNTGVFSTSEGGVVNLASSTPANASGKEVTSADFFQSNLLNYTTNRILEIPQDIKLELNNGTLTLKAGSKVYIPNGKNNDNSNKFDVVTIENDIEALSNNSTPFIYYNASTGVVTFDTTIYSGTTFPSNPITAQKFYKIDENYIYRFDGTNWNKHSYSLSLGFCKKATGSNNVISIEQVFNGFGYIGSTVFVLPGVKGAIPNSRNQDGTCKSILTTLTSVKTITFTNAAQRGLYLQTNIGASSGNSPVYSDTQPSQNYIRWFSQKDNQWYDTHESPELNSKSYILPLALFNTDSTGKITSFEPFTVDSVLNSSLSNLSAAGEAKLKSNIQLVNELPANPEPGVLYCIPEK